MRRVILILFSSLVLVLASTSVIFAQTPNTNFNRFEDRLRELREDRQRKLESLQEKQQELKGKRQDLKEKIATKQAELRQKVIARIKSVFTRILKRYNAALARLDKIADRIATRIDKLNARGVDTSAAQARLTEAEGLGTAAAQAIVDAQAQVSAIDENSATVKDAVHTATTAIKSAKRALFDYHKGLVAAIRELKAAAALKEGTRSAE